MTKVTLISDSEWVHNDVRAALDMPGTEIVVEEDPRRAAEASIDADVCLVDMQVGSMGGMAIVRRLRDAMYDGSLDTKPIVLLLDRTADRFLAKRAGADRWVVKPFTAQELRAEIIAPAGS